MIPGGIADKLGNRYEAKWLVLKLIDVVQGKKSSLCFEGTSEAFAGFEFLLVEGATKQWHQVKISNTLGQWSASRLQQANVLESFRKRLKLEDPNDQCHFISQDTAASLRDLSERARMANDYAEYTLSKKLTEEFQVVAEAWNVNEQVAFRWLQRVYCRTQSEVELDESIETFGGLCFSHNSALVFSALRDYMEQRFNRLLTTDDVRIEIPKFGVALAHWQLDATLTERIHDSNEDYLLSYPPVASDNVIPRTEAQLVVDELTAADGANIVLLTGGAGAGKSGVVHQVISTLQAQGIVHIALRADEFLDVATNEDIGQRLTARQESPVVTLKGVSGATASVLIIDQVDAVSEVSGRNTRLKPLLIRMLSDAEKFGTVKVLCVCRAFDLDNDPRLKALSAQESVRRIEIAPLGWSSEVRPLLERRGIHADKLSASQKKLLELPLNLGLFLEVHDEGRPFSSRNDLFTALLDKKARAIAGKRAPAWGLAQPLDALVKWMSDHQTLQAPLSALRSFDAASDILSSESLISVRGGRVHLFHESFFDYLFARGFVTTSHTLVGLLSSDEDQYLFRRTQVRQILESLRQDDRRRYLRELADILANTEVRYHVKLAVVQWLGSLSAPTRDELDVVLKLDVDAERMSPLVRAALYGSPRWFEIAESAKGLVSRELNSPFESRREDTLWWLSRVASLRTDEVGKLLERWYRSDVSGRGERLLDWFTLLRGQPVTGQLLSLCQVVTKEQAHLLLGKKNSYRASSLFDTLALGDSVEVAPIIERYFEAWFASHPDGHPFLRDEDELDIEPLQKLAAQTPANFLAATTCQRRFKSDPLFNESPK